MTRDRLAELIRSSTPATFDELALAVFRYQARHNPIYAHYLDLLHVSPNDVLQRTQIPHLPISLFKTHRLQCGDWQPVQTFTSSGTSGSTTSRHLLRQEDWYLSGARRNFEAVYGPLSGKVVLALLPAYLERQGSSLVHMADDFIRASGSADSGFYLDDLAKLSRVLTRLTEQRRPTLLLGVSFALLDLAERYAQPLGSTIVMETGGMKGRRRELTRGELHERLRTAFRVDRIHSEYGMTELLSQAYAPRGGRFLPSPTLRITAREITDPFASVPFGRTAALNLTDLANLDTISFIASDDLGRVYDDGSFEVLGRMDNSDIRGCNLLVGEE